MKIKNVLIAALVVTTVAKAGNNSADDMRILPDSLQIKILELKAAGRFQAAEDSLKRWVAQIKLEQKKKAAERKLHQIWNRQVLPLSIDASLQWVDGNKKKAHWLIERWERMGLIQLNAVNVGKYDFSKESELFRQRVKKAVAQMRQIKRVARRQLNSEIGEIKRRISKIESSLNQFNKRMGKLEAASDSLTHKFEWARKKLLELEQFHAKPDTTEE